MDSRTRLAIGCQNFFDDEEEVDFVEVIDEAFEHFRDPYEDMSDILRCSPEIIGQWKRRKRIPESDAQNMLVYELLMEISAEA